MTKSKARKELTLKKVEEYGVEVQIPNRETTAVYEESKIVKKIFVMQAYLFKIFFLSKLY